MRLAPRPGPAAADGDDLAVMLEEAGSADDHEPTAPLLRIERDEVAAP
jgi:hypothetical protein